MSVFKRCLKYAVTLLTPLVFLLASDAVCRSHGVVIRLTPLISFYVATFLVLSLIYRWRFRGWELIILFLPLPFLQLFCVTTDFHDAHEALYSFLYIHFGFYPYNFCMIYGAYLGKFLLEIVLNLRDAARKGKDAETAADGGGEEEADAPDMG